MDVHSTLLAGLRAAVAAGDTPGPAIRRALLESDDVALLRRAGRIAATLAADRCDLPVCRVDVLATGTVGSFDQLLRAGLLGAGALPVVECAPYGSFDLTLSSGAFASGRDPDVVVCVMAAEHFLHRDWDAADTAALGDHVQARAAELAQLVASCLRDTTATLVLHTVPLPAEVRDTLVSWRARSELALVWNRLNGAILELAEAHRQVVVVDLVNALAGAPVAARDERLHRYADLPYTDGALLILARETRRIAQARAGLSRKVLALDLDNTLWGGVLGEVGAHGVQLGGLYPGNCYLHLQRTARRLRDQGVLLVLASKNDAELVDDALTRHPEAVLAPEDFAARVVDWSPKGSNLRRAAEVLGLSTASFVFMDDSPHERAEVGLALPEVALVAADGDPAHLSGALLRHGWFDVLELTETDRRRPQLYRARADRGELERSFTTADGFLEALGIVVVAEPANAFTAGRVAQLAGRTNQFNLTGRRYGDTNGARAGDDPGRLVATFSVSDRFGDEGIVGAAWVDRGDDVWRVDNLVLSCRVLGRGVEFAMLEWLVRQAGAAGAAVVRGEFVPTARNTAASDFYVSAGFTPGPGDGVYERATDAPPGRATPWIQFHEKGTCEQLSCH